VNITIHVHDSWAAIPVALSRILAGLAALEQPRQPGDDGDDLAELLDGIDTPEPQPAPQPALSRPRPPAPAPTPAPAPAARPAPAPEEAPAPNGREWDGTLRTGRSLYRWAMDHKALPRINAIGKGFNYPKRITDWEPAQVAAAYAILTAEPAAATNGQAR
jgi:hypothetical protein